MTRREIRILDIDLTAEKAEVIHRDDLARFLGGTGLAARLFSEIMQPELDALHPDQPVVLANGPLTTIFPVVTKVVAVFRSPLTGEYGESHAGMRLGLAMRGAGVNVVIIRGKAKRPAYLVIGPQGVEFKNASALWGLPVGEVGQMLRKLAPGTGHRSSLRIGPAGEKMAAFASVNVDTFRHFGRLGLGAVFGSKNLKAVVVHGEQEEPIADPKAYKNAYEKIYQNVTGTNVMKKYHILGTPSNILPLNELGGLPAKNLQAGRTEGAENISGEAFAEKTLIRQTACSGCPIGCIHLGLHRTLFGPQYEIKSKLVSYDYELIFALGTFLGISSQDQIYALIDKVEELGLDAISAGVELGWLTEAFEKGLVDEETVGTALSFGNTEGYLYVLDNIVSQPNELYNALAKGTEYAARKFGGLDFALTTGKNEMAGYHTGHAHLFGQSMGSRHSHLDNAGYGIDQKNPDQDPERMVEAIVAEEKWRNVLTSLCICLFAREVYQPETAAEALKSIGIETSVEELESLGTEIFHLKHRIRTELGFKPEEIRFPKRFFDTPSAAGKLSRETITRMLEKYQKA